MAKTTSKKLSGGNDSWGTPDSFLVVFFPQDQDPDHDHDPLKHHPPDAAAASPANSPLPSPLPLASPFRRAPSRRLLLSRALSILSICALLLSPSLLLFSLSSLDHSHHHHHHHPTYSSLPIIWRRSSTQLNKALDSTKVVSPPSFALQGMGVLHRRGTHTMPDLVVGHIPEDTTEDGLRLFLRSLHRSGLTARSDVVLIFPDRSLSASFAKVIKDEDRTFLGLLDRRPLQGNRTIAQGKASDGVNALSIDVAQFFRKARKDKVAAEPLWGRRTTRSNYSDARDAATGHKGNPSYGSLVSFEAAELDPEGSLLGFLDHVPMSLRRWSCYSMLLGRLRRNFKHAMLIDVKNWAIILSDPFIGVRDRSSETVVMWGGMNAEDGKRHGKGKKEGGSDAAQSRQPRVNPGAMVGGMRGVRRMAEVMQTEIVRAAMRTQQRKGRRNGGTTTTTPAVSESGMMSQIAGKEFLAKNVELVVSAEEEDSTMGLSSHRRNKGNKSNS